MKDLILQSKLVVSKIYESIEKIESMEQIKEAVEKGSVSLLMPEGELISLAEVADEETIKTYIKNSIDRKVSDAAKYLEELTVKKPAGTINKEFDALFDEAPAEPKGKRAVIPSKEELEKDVTAGLKVADMIEKYQLGKSTIYRELNKYGLTKKKENQVNECASDTAEQKEEEQEAPAAEAPKQANKKSKGKKPQKAEEPKKAKKTVGKSGMELADYIESHRAEVMALYTKGPFSLKDLAIEYSCDNKELHEVLASKGLLRSKDK